MKDAFRAASFDEFVGQQPLRTTLTVHLTAALNEVRPLEHVLLMTHPGYGKTTIAHICKNFLEEPFLDLDPTLTVAKIQEKLAEFNHGIIFVDEFHRMSPTTMALFLALLEDGKISFPDGTWIEYPWLTVIAATTEPHLILPAVQDRFPIRPDYVDYDIADLRQIAGGMAVKAGLQLDDEILTGLARASGGTPRYVRRLIIAARDTHAALERPPTLDEILVVAQVREDGLTQKHLEYLRILRASKGGVGLTSIAGRLRLNEATVRDVERLLEKLGYIIYGRSGRELTHEGLIRIKEEDE